MRNPSEFWDDGRTEREFSESGLPCCTRTHERGHRCGYVMVREGHPLYGLTLWDDRGALGEIEVDGGITFAKGRDGCWILGWDAAHAWHEPDPSIMDEDFRKACGLIELVSAPFPTYMVDADMAEAETRKLARQVAAIGGDGA